MAYEVSTPVFEGPFDLLLHLITREQVDIYEISLSTIVDAYVGEMARLESLDLEVATEFLLIASTLIELKLRRLLPERDGIELDEEFGLLEERDLLLAKLLEYSTFRQAAENLQQRFDLAQRSFPRTAGPDERIAGLVPDVLAGVTAADLAAAFQRAMMREFLPKEPLTVVLDHVTAVRLSVAEVLAELADELPRIGTVTFRELTARCRERVEVIVHFLALLELFKQGWVDLDQATNFGDLRVAWLADGPPDDFESPWDAAALVGDDGSDDGSDGGSDDGSDGGSDDEHHRFEGDEASEGQRFSDTYPATRARVSFDVDEYEG